jgi:hypothetical protein
LLSKVGLLYSRVEARDTIAGAGAASKFDGKDMKGITKTLTKGEVRRKTERRKGRRREGK